MEKESKTKWKTCRVFVRQGERKSEEVETAWGSRRRGGNSVRKSEERRRQREQLEGKAKTAWSSVWKGEDSVRKSAERPRETEIVGGSRDREVVVLQKRGGRRSPWENTPTTATIVEGIESSGSESMATTTIPQEAVPQHHFSVRFVFFCSPLEKV